jgi:hypothetical protein
LARVGRKTKYTPETVERILQAIRLGAAYEHACASAGIEYETFRRWTHEKSGFNASVKEAEAKGVQTWLARIEQAANSGVWTAAAWKLERLYPHIYGRTIQEHTGLNGGPIEVADVSDRDRIASRMDELAERRRARELAQQPIRHGSEEAAV